MHFERRNIIFFPEKKTTIKKNVCAYLKFSDLLPKTHLFFYLALAIVTYDLAVVQNIFSTFKSICIIDLDDSDLSIHSPLF